MEDPLLDWVRTFAGPYDIYIRIVLSALLGLLIGFDRTHKNKPAGVKTFTFVAVASTLITIVSIESVGVYSGIHEHTMMDPMRLAAQIVTGLGFLGAGVIMKSGFEVKGLTSAAMIFFAGGVGVGIGAGFYGIVLFTMLVCFVFTRIGGWIEKKESMQRHYRGHRRSGGESVREQDKGER
ncbi:MgtC/SapB family protein [Paenibacillus sp. IB182496]|uniref:MgtC/SapB family protein n=1 Tax=Paenibacillus sabuli TaxID=2772509 RepID=A0A927GRX8_9BACL|nr:MgtC/SapB family protein [Paenibacillus sabuli]MBD2845958.1 MgtC/SapB family protein [Paenibacillus sabuli]